MWPPSNNIVNLNNLTRWLRGSTSEPCALPAGPFTWTNRAMMAMPWGFPTASSMLPNSVEFQWIRWSWEENTASLSILLGQPGPRNLHGVQYKRTTVSPKPTTAPSKVLCKSPPSFYPAQGDSKFHTWWAVVLQIQAVNGKGAKRQV